MKRAIFILTTLLLLSGCRGQITEEAIRRQLSDYPESRVQDIYKSFCQDNLGPGHLIPDPQSARNYLDGELAEYRQELDSQQCPVPEIRYLSVGDQGNYVRVDLSVILDGLVPKEQFLDAFVRSANSGKVIPEAEWLKKWNSVSELIRDRFRDIPDAGKDLARLDSLLKGGDLIQHHSPEYGQAYRPHYRIVAKDIFEKELKPLIDGAL
ncbi:MAG: hypothetical protein K5910_07885 [Bacteroidales bacterium]|nr:hypothetical protein [Bacteroidales bacterium]